MWFSIIQPLVEGEEGCPTTFQCPSHIHKTGIYSKMSHATSQFEDLVLWASILLVLFDGMIYRLSGIGIFEFDRKDGQAIDKKGEIDTVFVPVCIDQFLRYGKSILLYFFWSF